MSVVYRLKLNLQPLLTYAEQMKIREPYNLETYQEEYKDYSAF